MDEFYQKAKGLMILVIRHNGETFDYVNGYKNNQYFASWKPVLPFLEHGHYYSIVCLVKDNKGKAKLQPFGVLMEFANEEEAKSFSFSVRTLIDSGQWKGIEVLDEFKQECIKFITEYCRKKMVEITMLPG